MGSKNRLVLATENPGHFGREATQDEVLGVYNPPLPLDLGQLWRKRSHACAFQNRDPALTARRNEATA